MGEREAYPDGSTFEQRATRRYKVGDLVNVGRPYMGYGAYGSDGFSGLHTVVGGDGPDYRLVRGDVRDWVREDPEGACHGFDVWIHAARLTPVSFKAGVTDQERWVGGHG